MANDIACHGVASCRVGMCSRRRSWPSNSTTIADNAGPSAIAIRPSVKLPAASRTEPPDASAGVCYFGRKRIGAARSAHDVSGDCAGLSMKSAAILAPHGLNALTL